MSARAVETASGEPHSEIDHAIAWHDGDMKATIATLLEDCRHLRAQLAAATAAMGHGYTRGWVPEDERDKRH